MSLTPIRRTIPLEATGAGTPLYADFALRTATPVHDVLGDFRAQAPDWLRVRERSSRVDARLVERLVESNRALGAGEAVLDGLRGLADGSVRAIVTGQQPGVAGGPLLTLYKIATACALARQAQTRFGVRCVPVFWMGADDDDVAEIREFTVLAKDLAVVSASIEASAYAPGMRVGDISAQAVRDVAGAVASYLPGSGGVVGDVIASFALARDLGDAAARAVVRLTAGEVAVIDGREPLIRTCARDLLLRFFDREEDIRGMVAREGARLVAAGYHAQLDLGASSGVFHVANGVRHKVPSERRSEARLEFERDITQASPGVVARNLVQDSLFAPLAAVLGPAEIAYRAQLGPVYREFAVPAPVVFPRMSATFVPPAVRDLAESAGIDASVFALDPASVPEQARRRLVDEGFREAAREADEAFRTLAANFTDIAGERLDVRNRDRLEKRFADIAQRLRQTVDSALEHDTRGRQARYPFLPRTAEMFVRGGVAQERFLSMIVPFAFHGADAWTAIRSLADDATASALDGRVGHRVYSL